VYDPGLDVWHILWNDPLKQLYTRQIGRKQGDDIVQIGQHDAATLRWSFTRIKPDSFLWTGERSFDDGKSWSIQSQFDARRS
jgi:hypothetical protein